MIWLQASRSCNWPAIPATASLSCSRAVQSGRAYVANLKGECPDLALPNAYGWHRADSSITPSFAAHKIGWVEGQSLYLLPAAAIKVAEDMLGRTEDQLSLSGTNLGRQLLEQKYLVSTGLHTTQKRILVRKTVEDKQVVSVYAIKCSALIPLDRSGEVPAAPENGDNEA